MFRFNHPSVSNTSPEQKPEQSRSTSLKKALAIGAVPFLLLFGAAFQSSNSVPGQLQAIQAQIASLANKGPRKFYLTKTEHNGAQALSACAPSYHMASMWEVFDLSNLRYDTALGDTSADSGSGPPNLEGGQGWIRTGGLSNSAGISGIGNCNAWTDAGAMVNGSFVFLPDVWGSDGPRISPWIAGASDCSNPKKVWCVED